MSDDLVKQSIAELQDLVRCQCHEAYKGRGLHDPDCLCDNAEAVKVVADRIEELEAKLRDLFMENLVSLGKAQDAHQAQLEAEAKLAKCVLVEYDNGDVVSLSSFAGGASEGGSWSTLTLMKEEANGDISFREYKAVKDWETTLAELTGGKDE